MHSRAEYERVAELLRAGMNDCQVERATGISRRTVLDWRHKGQPGCRTGTLKRGGCPVCDHEQLDGGRYAYLLGLYLGDGCLARVRKTWCLRIVQDARYTTLIAQCAETIRATSTRSVSLARKTGCVVIACYWNHWPCLFPQHAPGRRHHRKIELVPWQRHIAAEHPAQLVAGLIHSDGCRVVNHVNGKGYPRYHFVNFSNDIRRIFTDACDALGVSWTQPKWQEVSIARAPDVALLDALIPRKA